MFQANKFEETENVKKYLMVLLRDLACNKELFCVNIGS
jgi:hypothetical protein